MSIPSPAGPIGPADASLTPRYSGLGTFARLPTIDSVVSCDVAVLGVPFDSGVSYRPGARFGPAAIREASRLLRPYHPDLAVEPFAVQQVADAGDVACNPFSIVDSILAVEQAAGKLIATGAKVIALGGDHTIALPLIRSCASVHGPVALVHFDAHLDTWDSYFGVQYTHGTPFRRAVEEGLLNVEALTHVGTRGPLYAANDIEQDESLGFAVVTSMDVMNHGVPAVIHGIRQRVGTRPMYVSVDIDVLDPAHAPGTGTPEAGGMTSRELLGILRGLSGMNLVGGDVVEVSPPYDHSQITATAASHVAYELISLLATRRSTQSPAAT